MLVQTSGAIYRDAVLPVEEFPRPSYFYNGNSLTWKDGLHKTEPVVQVLQSVIPLFYIRHAIYVIVFNLLNRNSSSHVIDIVSNIHAKVGLFFNRARMQSGKASGVLL